MATFQTPAEVFRAHGYAVGTPDNLTNVDRSIEILTSQAVFFEHVPAVNVSRRPFNRAKLRAGHENSPTRHVVRSRDPTSFTVHCNEGDRFYGAAPGVYVDDTNATLITALDSKVFTDSSRLREAVVVPQDPGSFYDLFKMTFAVMIPFQHPCHSYRFWEGIRGGIYHGIRHDALFRDVFPKSLDYVVLCRMDNDKSPVFKVYVPRTLRLVWLFVVWSH